MNEEQIRNPEDLDAAIVGQARSKQSKLVRVAEGRSMSFSVSVMLLLSFVLRAFRELQRRSEHRVTRLERKTVEPFRESAVADADKS